MQIRYAPLVKADETSQTSQPIKPMTPNQIVALNLRRARLARGWQQKEAAAALEPYLGASWSKASYSAAERSVSGERVRVFSADDLVAFSRAFGVPVTYFLSPPDPVTVEVEHVVRKRPDGSLFLLTTST